MASITRRRATGGLLGLAAAAGWSGRAVAAEPVRVGVALSQSGNLADSGELFKRGVDLWREDVNRRGGLLGRPVEIVLYDDRSDPATAARLYERLITSDKVDLLLSPWGSASCATASAVAEKHKRVFVNAGGASEAIHQRGFKFVFQSAPADLVLRVRHRCRSRRRYGFKTIAIVVARLRGGPRHDQGRWNGSRPRTT